jgi:hypothetical protein
VSASVSIGLGASLSYTGPHERMLVAWPQLARPMASVRVHDASFLGQQTRNERPTTASDFYQYQNRRDLFCLALLVIAAVCCSISGELARPT